MVLDITRHTWAAGFAVILLEKQGEFCFMGLLVTIQSITLIIWVFVATTRILKTPPHVAMERFMTRNKVVATTIKSFLWSRSPQRRTRSVVVPFHTIPKQILGGQSGCILGFAIAKSKVGIVVPTGSLMTFQNRVQGKWMMENLADVQIAETFLHALLAIPIRLALVTGAITVKRTR